MKKLLEMLTEEMQQAFTVAGYDGTLGKVMLSNRPDLCEYQCNGAMAAAKAYKKAPFMIADDVAAIPTFISMEIWMWQRSLRTARYFPRLWPWLPAS